MTAAATRRRPATTPDASGEAPQGAKTEAAAFAAVLPAGVFAAAVGKAAAVVPARTPIPIVAHLLLEFAPEDGDAGGRLTVTGSNLEQTVQVAVRAAGHGAVAVPANELRAAVRNLSAEADVVVAPDAARATLLVLKQGRTTYKLPTLPAADYPVLTEVPGAGEPWRVKAADLAAALKATEPAASSEETRFYLCGAFFDFARAAIVATDSFRLHKVPLPAGDGPVPPKERSFILPREAVRPIVDAAKDVAEIDLLAGETKLQVRAGAVTLTTKLIDGVFPDWARVVPGDMPQRASVDAKEFLAALERVSIIAAVQVNSDSARTVTGVKLAVADGELTLTNRAQATGEEAVTVCGCALLAGAPQEIGFNANYLAAAVRSLGDVDTIEIAWADAGDGPVRLSVLSDPDRTQIRVVMQLRV